MKKQKKKKKKRKPHSGWQAKPKTARGKNTHALARQLYGSAKGLVRRTHKPPLPTAIRAFRQLLGLSQVSFASQLGCNALQVSFWERGTRSPGKVLTNKLVELAKMNNVDLALVTDPDYQEKIRGELRVKVFIDREEKIA